MILNPTGSFQKGVPANLQAFGIAQNARKKRGNIDGRRESCRNRDIILFSLRSPLESGVGPAAL